MEKSKNICFITYLLINVLHGILLSSFGPAIIYFTKATQKNEDQTYYSFIFFTKAVGYLIGGSLAKVLTKYFTYHQLLSIVLAICGLALIISSFDFGFWNLSITMMIVGSTQCIKDILSTLCIFQIFFQDNEQYWLQLSHIFIGIGGLIGPIMVVYTEELAFRTIGVLFILALFPLLILKSPQNKPRQQQKDGQNEQLLQLPRSAEMGLCLIIFTYVGLIASYVNWMPTYAVKSGALHEKSANLLVSIFWIMELSGKIILLFMKDTIPKKTYFLLKCLIISGVITVLLQLFQYSTIVCYFGVISAGFFLSALYGLFFTVAQSYGYRLSQSATANMTICSVLAQALLVTPIGFLIGNLGEKSFIYSVFGISAVMFWIYIKTNKILEQGLKGKRKGDQIEMGIEMVLIS